MNLLVLSTDRNAFDPHSSVRERLRAQAKLVDRMDVVVFALKGRGDTEEQVTRHLAIRSTRSIAQAFFLPDAFMIAQKIMRAHKGEWVVTAQDPFWAGALGWIIARFLGAALHIQLHTDIFSNEWRKSRPFPSSLFPLSLASFLLAHADGVRVIAQRLCRGVRALGVPDERITVVPIPVNVSKFRDAEVTVDLRKAYPEYAKVILAMGRLTREKNFGLLLRAFARLRKDKVDAVLVLVGHGPMESELRFLARSLDIDRHVRFLPWARDVASYYKTADVYVQPSLYEGWGLAVVEAMAVGTPVVMTDVGCAGELVRDGETGLVVPVGDEEAFHRALTRIALDDDLRKRLSKNAQEAVAELATEEEALKLYKESWERAYDHLRKA